MTADVKSKISRLVFFSYDLFDLNDQRSCSVFDLSLNCVKNEGEKRMFVKWYFITLGII